MSDRRSPMPHLPGFGAFTSAAFDIAAGTATLVSQNDGWPTYNIVALSVFYPSNKVTHNGVEPQRFWDVYTVGEDTGPALGFYMPNYGFPTTNGWVWFVLNEKIEFKDCVNGARGGGSRTQFGLDAMRLVAEQALLRAPAPATQEATERPGIIERIRRFFGGGQ